MCGGNNWQILKMKLKIVGHLRRDLGRTKAGYWLFDMIDKSLYCATLYDCPQPCDKLAEEMG